MLYGIGGADTALTGKLRELGIPYLYMGEHCEESPLGKSEWVVVAAEIAGLRTEGSRLFAAIPERYERLRALAQQTAARPRVMLNTPYRDTWFMPARNSYMVRLLEDAGARYVFEENTATQTLPIDIEQAYYLTSKSDFWLNVSGCNTLDEVRRQESPAGRHASRARGARLRQQPPPQRGGRQRFLGIGRTASRPRAGGSGAHLPPPNSPKRTNCTITGSWNNAEAAPLRRIRPLLRFSRRRRPHCSFFGKFFDGSKIISIFRFVRLSMLRPMKNADRRPLPVRIFRFYYDGFREMTLGRTLWAIILIKLFILFVVLRLLFSPTSWAARAPKSAAKSCATNW